jgi:hypothetical protein
LTEIEIDTVNERDNSKDRKRDTNFELSVKFWLVAALVLFDKK